MAESLCNPAFGAGHKPIFGPGGLLEERGRDRMVHRGVGADQERHVGSRDVVKHVGDRPRSNRLHQRRDRAGVAEPRAVVHVIGPEHGADELLE